MGEQQIESNEQWLSDGFCPACRREDYCKKPCKAQRERKKAILEQMAMRKIAEQLLKKQAAKVAEQKESK